MKVRLLAEAQEEMQWAARWYEEKEPGLGDDFLDDVSRSLESIEKNPFSYARLETLKNPGEVRRRIMSRFPYLVIYEIRAEEVLVLAVAQASRKPNYWKKRRES